MCSSTKSSFKYHLKPCISLLGNTLLDIGWQ